MRKLLLSVIGIFGLMAAQAQTKYITGTIYDASPAGKQVNYEYFTLDSMGVLADSGSGVWTSNSSGLITATLTLSTPYRYGEIRFNATNCNGQALSQLDSFSNGMWGDSLFFKFYLCEQNKLDLSGSFFHQPGYYPAANEMIYIYADSGYRMTPTLALIDSVATDTFGSYSKTVTLPSTWLSGTVWINYGCAANRQLDQFYYFLYNNNGYRTQEIYTGAKTFCYIPQPYVAFSGLITDSTGNPVPHYRFSINIDSINGQPDTAIHTRYVTTNAYGFYYDSMPVPPGTNDVHIVYYLASCGSLITETESATLILNQTKVNKDMKMCGYFEWEIVGYANIYANAGTMPQALTVNVLITDTLGNGLDSFQVYKGIWNNLVEARRYVSWSTPSAYISFRFEDCSGTRTTTPVRGDMGQVNPLDLGDYYTCVPIVDTLLVYLAAQDTISNRTGTLYLITATIDTTATPWDTVLNLIDTFPVNNSAYAWIASSYPGTCYLKFAASPTDPLYSQLLPTYWGIDSPLTWRDAGAFTFSGGLIPSVLHIRTGTNPGGPGFVSGSLSSGAGKKANPTADVAVLLYDQNMRPVKSSISDASGEYKFEYIAYGTYYLVVDVPGRDMIPYQVVVDADHLDPQVDFIVNKKNIVAKQATSTGKVVQNIRSIYPNPAQDKAVITFDHQGDFELEVYNLLGEQVYKQKVNGNQTEVAVGSWTPGTYMVRLQDTASGQLWLGKLLVH